MKAFVKEVHVQDLVPVLDGEFSTAELADACRRFEVEEDILEDLEESTLEGLRGIAATEQFEPLLAYLLKTGDWDDQQVESFEEALEGSPLSVRRGEGGELELIKTVSPAADRGVPDKRTYLEENAPQVIMTQIEAAESNLVAGDYEFATAEIRRAMDMLVVGGFDEGLEEFAEQGLIQLGDEHEHSDATMLYVAYGYCSFLGGNPEQKGFETSRLQAEVAVVLGEEALYFILETMERAAEQGIELRRWELP